jgi:hypothetical protein
MNIIVYKEFLLTFGALAAIYSPQFEKHRSTLLEDLNKAEKGKNRSTSFHSMASV